ncbi:hypothetical protein HK104_011302 [Borealophlyctis nickersoniae]|nr:hypothetical protein HK104_011302 [Borealophlyctis nickersoniae]
MAGTPPDSQRAPRKRQRTNPKQAQVRVIDDENEPSGDELDTSLRSMVALERYKRNHMFIDQIFSPYSTSMIVPNRVSQKLSPEVLADLKRQLAELNAEVAKLADSNYKDRERVQSSSKAVWKAIDEVKHAKTLQVRAAFMILDPPLRWTYTWMSQDLGGREEIKLQR